ncbi:YHS domain-containing (seleno)protein [Glaciecola sp. SC05]|uniref:YHS domain-containing (seleno)protein n=1 Tax=Glaciecola sp. SC05 TaxID=1987355 RepID=UPI003527F1C0
MKLHTLLKATAIAASLAFSAFTFAADIDVNANSNDIAIGGYDPVSYFTQSAPVKGAAEFSATYKNAIYQFASEKNRDAFKANPEKFAPQFGGFCAFGVTMDRKFDTDPLAYKIVDQKLYLNLNAEVQQRWLSNVPEFIQTADQNWGGIKGKTDAVLAAASE